jgi:large subunit ribosomal protein L19
MTHQKLLNSSVVQQQLRTDIPDFNTGNIVKVYYKIKEGVKERIQIFEGIVISRKSGSSVNAAFTVLKNSTVGMKVERTFPLHSPYIEKIEVAGGVVRAKKSKLYHLRDVKDPLKAAKTKKVAVKVVV